ncbi:putative dihydroxyacetone kinase (DakA) [Aspergillus clavatus NRRL 1]|uniref:Dihydroxyacetone kinase (DakA), putative n=1 Tax=Aspergillus clavatus (strain ATCC 1007 / CBS 513.65 / DSM 816 / NCTC 3887 / NRRL 1 / QM 1276 / 107) TaxID=344612 RepID=A1CBL3_ASPCL|nr:dihydroxyacetone kinase (DakA), putative [Aspergillus clavatus NRRL 1]EAW13131.1 dihydroxyacetone kinase (DakA), putative [Aspergillus clavatus NRRL 1]
MQTKHFFSDPNHLVLTALHSLTLTNPSLAFDPEQKVVFRRPDPSRKPKVAIISGGGSGHEPAFAGYVGHGLLDASAAGTIFASPSAEQIRHAAMNCVDNEKGVLIIPMNYTGDVLNFGMGTEKARAAGIKTEFFAINDDAGVGKKKGGKVGRRGIGGGILVLKIVGALAEAGGSLEEVYHIARFANDHLASVGSSLEHVHIPGRAVPEDTIPDGQVEVGMGIHNEPGSHRMKFDLPDVVKTMLLQILDHNDPDRAYLTRHPEDEFVLLINNLGGVSTLELSGITDEVYHQLEKDFDIKPVRVIQGTFLTSLNGLGFSISLLKLADTGLGPGKSLLELLDAPAEAVGWSAPIRPATWNARHSDAPLKVKSVKPAEEQPSNLKLNPAALKKVLGSGLKRVIAAEPLVTRYDTIVGDGDCGVGMKRGAEAVLSLLEDPSSNITDDAVTAVNRIITVVENTMDGTSGAIYAIFLNALAHGLRAQDRGSAAPATTDIWAAALKHAVTALAKYTPAQPGDRTMIDALVPFCNTLLETKDVHAAAKAAQDGTEATKSMKASLGRAVYVGGEEEWVGKIPDPGAYGLSEFLNGLAEAM